MVSSFSPTAAELNIVAQIFAQADPGKLGVVTGDAAVKTFAGAKLQPAVLGEIWAIADDENNGWLSKKGVAKAVRLIGWAQHGEKITAALVDKPGPIPSIDGISSITSHSTGMSMPRSPPPLSLPPFTPQDKVKFQRLFQSSGPTNGLLSGDKARDIFVKSKLSVDKLSQIWNLADTQDRGMLDVTDFSIGMYFIQACMSGQLSFVPTSLPPGLYEQAGGVSRQHTGITTHMTGSLSPTNTGTFSSQIRPQYTGQSGMTASTIHTPVRPAPSAVGASAFGSVRTGLTVQAAPWDVTPAEKSNADRLFDGLDLQKNGYIEGEVAVPFMLESKLSGDDLAQIWDLADINGDGRLTRDGFAVAMHLIQSKIAGKPIPATLPPSLVPPSMRPGASSAFTPTVPAPTKPTEDLLWGDDSPPASAAPYTPSFPAQPPQVASPPPPARAPPSQDPFGSSPFSAPTSHAAHNFLDDDNDVSSSLHDQSAEIGNVQNQLNSTNRSLETTKSERVNMETQLANQAAQLSQFQTQLSSAKASFETESKLLGTLKERFSTQSLEIQKAREELIRAESDLSAVKVEKAEIEGTFLRDKEEVRGLQRRMLETGQQIETTKAEVEKLKREAKQQKGLLAIAKKQLSTKEAEKSKLGKDVDELKAETQEIIKEKEEAEAELANIASMPTVASTDTLTTAVAQPLPLSPEVTGSVMMSPASKSNNPFDRLTKSNHNSPRSAAAFLPFADSVLPTPPTAPQQSQTTEESPFDFSAPESTDTEAKNDDLFDFTQAFGTPEPHPSSAIPAFSLAQDATEHANNFSTPPDSPTSPNVASENGHVFSPPQPSAGIPDASSNGLGSTEPISPDDPKPPGHLALDSDDDKGKDNDLVDLGHQIKELEIDESDSSDEEDEVPLSVLADKMEKSLTQDDAPAQDNTNTAFFGDSVFDNKLAIGAEQLPVSDTPGANGIAGANAFDEAMGKIPSSATPSAPGFTFDSAFDDNFDFAAASEVDATSPPAPQPATNGNAMFPSPPSANKDAAHSFTPLTNGASAAPPVSFEDVFSSPSQPAQPKPIETAAPPAAQSKPDPAFDDIFGGLSASPKVDTALASTSQASDASHDFPSVSNPASPKGSLSYARPASPAPRAKSPTISTLSAKQQRPSTSSSKEEKEKPSAPPPRHSKISIRLPFGKKKKSEAPPPPPVRSQLLTPPEEEPSGTSTPAVSDDVEAVKQLCGMGFGRTQAVAALEKHGYDVQKALNSLLGQ